MQSPISTAWLITYSKVASSNVQLDPVDDRAEEEEAEDGIC